MNAPENFGQGDKNDLLSKPRDIAKKLILVTTCSRFDFRIYNMAFHDLTFPNIALPKSFPTLFDLNTNFCPTPNIVKPKIYQTALDYTFRSIRLSNNFGKNNRKPNSMFLIRFYLQKLLNITYHLPLKS
eukprot:Pgem_evm2s15179